MNRATALSIAIEDKRQRIFLLMEAIGLAGLLLPHAEVTPARAGSGRDKNGAAPSR